MQIEESNKLNPQQEQQVRALWNNEYPAHLNYHTSAEFSVYLSQLADQHHFLLIDVGQNIIGWAFDFIRNNERWFGIIVARDFQGKGFGTELLHHLKQNNDVLNGWVIDHNHYIRTDGLPYPSPVHFYIKNDFEIIPEERLGIDKISAVKITWIKN